MDDLQMGQSWQLRGVNYEHILLRQGCRSKVFGVLGTQYAEAY